MMWTLSRARLARVMAGSGRGMSPSKGRIHVEFALVHCLLYLYKTEHHFPCMDILIYVYHLLEVFYIGGGGTILYSTRSVFSSLFWSPHPF